MRRSARPSPTPRSTALPRASARAPTRPPTASRGCPHRCRAARGAGALLGSPHAARLRHAIRPSRAPSRRRSSTTCRAASYVATPARRCCPRDRPLSALPRPFPLQPAERDVGSELRAVVLRGRHGGPERHGLLARGAISAAGRPPAGSKQSCHEFGFFQSSSGPQLCVRADAQRERRGRGHRRARTASRTGPPADAAGRLLANQEYGGRRIAGTTSRCRRGRWTCACARDRPADRPALPGGPTTARATPPRGRTCGRAPPTPAAARASRWWS